MGLDDAYTKAVEAMAQVDQRAAALASGAEYRMDSFVIPLFERKYTIQFPNCDISQIGSDDSVPRIIEVLLMHYLAHADGAAVSGDWISYRQLPGVKLFEKRFSNLVLRPMIDCFGDDVNRFREAAQSLGGKVMEARGDAAFKLNALPRLPVACIFNRSEEGIPPSINVLFDESAPHYLPTEDLTVLGGIMSSFMKMSLKRIAERSKYE